MSAARLWGRPWSRPCVRIFQDGQVILAKYASAETDASGDYRLADLAGGRYYIRAHAPAADDDPQTAHTGVPTYHPNTLAAAAAEAVRVAPPSELRRIDLTLQPVDTAAVSGRIMSGTGALLLGSAVTLTPHVGGRVVLGATTGSRVEPDGTFVFPDVPPGSFMIQARALDEATPRMQFATFHIITTGRDVSNIVMTLRGGARVEGAVVVREGEGPESWDGLSVRAPTADPSAVGSDPIARVRPDGTFSLPAMQDGPRFFRIDGLPAGWTLDSVRYHGQDITEVPLDLQSSQQLFDLQLVIRAGQPSITGALRTSRGGVRTDRTVVAFSTNPGFWAPYARRVRLAQPDPSGRYALTGLPAGRYHVVVEELDRSELFIEDRLQSLAETADTVLVQDDAVARLDLTIPSPTDQRYQPGTPGSSFFFVAFFFGGTRACGWPQRLAMIVDWQSLDVKRYRTPTGLALDHGQHRTPRDTGTEPETTPARQSCLVKAFQRRVSSITHGSGLRGDGSSPRSHPRGNHTPTGVARGVLDRRKDSEQCLDVAFDLLLRGKPYVLLAQRAVPRDVEGDRNAPERPKRFLEIVATQSHE